MIKQISKMIIVLGGIYLLCLTASCCRVSTTAGTGAVGCMDGSKSSAQFNNPSGLVSDPWEHLYIADASCHKIRQIVHGAGNVTTFAGTGSAGCDDGPVLTTATFNYPVDIARDNAGNFYVADRNNHVIRKITQAGLVTTIAGQCGKALLPPDYHQGEAPCQVTTLVPDSISADSALFNSPSAVAVDASGNVYVADFGTCSVRKIDVVRNIVVTLGKIGGTKVGANVGCCGCSGPFNYPAGIDLDASGNIYVAEYWGHRIRKIDASTEDITVWAGSGWGYRNGPGNEACFMFPYHLVVDKKTGNIYVADLGNNRIRKISNDAAHTVSTVTGSGILGFKNGSCSEAQFNNPRGIEFVNKGLIYVGDTNNNRVRKIKKYGSF